MPPVPFLNAVLYVGAIGSTTPYIHFRGLRPYLNWCGHAYRWESTTPMQILITDAHRQKYSYLTIKVGERWFWL